MCQYGSSASLNVRLPFLNAIVFDSLLPKISLATMSVEPEGRLSASDFVCTTRPSSKTPSSVDVLNMSESAVTVCPPEFSVVCSRLTLPEA